ncbi:MAG: thrombospondin type 3 repeat-containing protein [bacterium]
MPEDFQFDETGGDFEENPEQPPQPLSKSQKIMAAGLAVFAILTVVLWIAQLRSNIYGPFKAPSNQKQIVSEEQNGDSALKSKDTDSDGLNDYDELNIYGTSPYLEDTDSDGVNDGEEVKAGEDPNCPKGKTCSGGLSDSSALDQAANPAEADNGTFNSLLNQFGAVNSAENPPASQQTDLNSDQLNLLKNIDAASLRQLLLQSGMKKEMLDQISDADLMKTYSETLNAGAATR